MTTEDIQPRSFEQRLRRAAVRQGLRLRKSRRQDPRALDYGRFWLFDARRNTLVLGGQYGATLDEIQTALDEGVRR